MTYGCLACYIRLVSAHTVLRRRVYKLRVEKDARKVPASHSTPFNGPSRFVNQSVAFFIHHLYAYICIHRYGANPFSRNLNTLYPRPTYICISDRYFRFFWFTLSPLHRVPRQSLNRIYETSWKCRTKFFIRRMVFEEIEFEHLLSIFELLSNSRLEKSE